MKKKLFLLLCLLPLTGLQSEEFNFAKEIRQSFKFKDLGDRINAYKKIVAALRPEYSTRLSKKLIRIFADSLHELCAEQEKKEIKEAFAELLQLAIENEKLRSVDHGHELPALLELYESKKPKPAPVAESEETFVPELDAPAPLPIELEIEIEPVAIKPTINKKTSAKRPLVERVKQIKRSDIAQTLMLRELLNQVTQLKNEFHEMQKSVDQLSDKTFANRRLLARLNNLERDLLAQQQTPTKSINLKGELTQGFDSEEWGPMLREWILDEISEPSITPALQP